MPTPGAPAPEVTKPDQTGPPLVGIGASAGALAAFQRFFAAMPSDSGIAFVLIPHLNPRHESLMVNLLARNMSMPVTQAEDGTRPEANHVYIVPPNKYLTISKGILRLSGPIERGGPPTSIDHFLRSLGEDTQEHAICIILTGTGADGTLGLKAVKAAGGLAIVQDPETAEYPAMPENAIATGLADFVLSVEEMPEAIVKYLRHDTWSGSRVEAEVGKKPNQLNQLLALLYTHTKLDFRPYRTKMILRRIDRRMNLRHLDQLPAYLAYLRQHPEEFQLLARDLLISVTSFFRDSEAWRALETEVIAPLVRARQEGLPIRIWSAGCATGEEAYSLAMLVLEQLTATQKNCPVQIFATDVDGTALETAREGTYPDGISVDVSPERLARFFTRVNGSGYQVSKQLRDSVIFAHQNLISDPPFSRLDLIVCRNLLMYLESEMQPKVLSLLHFALHEGGHLFLGTSETIGLQTGLFETTSKQWRIFRRLGLARAGRVKFPLTLGEAPPSKPTAQPVRARCGQPILLI